MSDNVLIVDNNMLSQLHAAGGIDALDLLSSND